MKHADKNAAHPVFDTETYWGEEEFAYDGSDNCIYIGKHRQHKASFGDTGWHIWKMTWTAGVNMDLCTRKEYLRGSWTNRASLDWRT